MKTRPVLVPVLLAFSLGACGNGLDESGGTGILSIHLKRYEPSDGIESVTFNISTIAISETGEDWTTIEEDLEGIVIDSDQRLDLVDASLPVGEYHAVKVVLVPTINFILASGGIVEKDFPDLVLYIQGGVYRTSNSGNGFPDTNEYFLFTTRNLMLTSPIVVDPVEKSFVVISFSPRDLGGDGYGLAAMIAYSSFLE